MASTMTMKHTISHNVFFFSSFVSIFCNRFVTVTSVDDMVFFHISLFVTISLSLYHSLDVPLSPSRSFLFLHFKLHWIWTCRSEHQCPNCNYSLMRSYILFCSCIGFSSFYLWISICLVNLIKMLHNFAEII